MRIDDRLTSGGFFRRIPLGFLTYRTDANGRWSLDVPLGAATVVRTVYLIKT